jgi:hypothetical protein
MAPIRKTGPKAFKALIPASSAVSGAAGTYWVLTRPVISLSTEIAQIITLFVFLGTLAKAYGWIDTDE